MPHLLAQWQQQVLEPQQRLLAESLARAAQHLGCTDSLLLHHPWLAMAPALHTMVTQMLFGSAAQAAASACQAAEAARAGYVDLLTVLLSPRSGSEPV